MALLFPAAWRVFVQPSLEVFLRVTFSVSRGASCLQRLPGFLCSQASAPQGEGAVSPDSALTLRCDGSSLKSSRFEEQVVTRVLNERECVCALTADELELSPPHPSGCVPRDAAGCSLPTTGRCSGEMHMGSGDSSVCSGRSSGFEP